MILFSAFQSDLDWRIKKNLNRRSSWTPEVLARKARNWVMWILDNWWMDGPIRPLRVPWIQGGSADLLMFMFGNRSFKQDRKPHPCILAASFEHCLPYHAILVPHPYHIRTIPYHMTAFNEGWRLGEAGEWLAIISCGPTIVIFLQDIFDPKETFVTAKLRCRNMQKPCNLGTIVFALMFTFWTTCEAEMQLVPNHPNQPTNPIKNEVLVVYLGENSCEPKLLEWMTGR